MGRLGIIGFQSDSPLRRVAAKRTGHLVAGLLLGWFLWTVSVQAQSQFAASRSHGAERTATREEVIANFLMNCLHFGDWSRTDSTNPPPETIAVIGDDPRDALRKTLKALISCSPESRIRYEAIPADAPLELKDCRVIFITSLKAAEVADTIQKLKGHRVILVGECESFLELGGAIELRARPGNKLRFQVNLDRLEQIKVRFKPDFLKYAAGFLHQGSRRPDFPLTGKP